MKQYRIYHFGSTDAKYNLKPTKHKINKIYQRKAKRNRKYQRYPLKFILMLFYKCLSCVYSQLYLILRTKISFSKLFSNLFYLYHIKIISYLNSSPNLLLYSLRKNILIVHFCGVNLHFSDDYDVEHLFLFIRNHLFSLLKSLHKYFANILLIYFP